MRRFEYTAIARRDLAEIHERIFDQDQTTAALVVDRIQNIVESISTLPTMGKPVGQAGNWVIGGSPKSPFRITYRFNEDCVFIVRIFRARRKNIQF